jgi:hypothetical protein
MNLGFCESRHYKTLFDEECSTSFDQRKHDKLHWWQNPRELHKCNFGNVRLENGIHFRTGKGNISETGKKKNI